MTASIAALQAYVEAKKGVQQMRILRSRYFYPGTNSYSDTNSAFVTVNLNLTINSVPIPATELAFTNVAVASRVSAKLAELFDEAIAEQEARVLSMKEAAKAEYEALFGS